MEGNSRVVEHDWLDALSVVRSDVEVQTRDDAAEVFVAEAARVRLADRHGPARLVLRSGTVLSGVLRGDGEVVMGVLQLDDDDRYALVRRTACLRIVGSTPTLRPDGSGPRPRTLASVLRDWWSAADAVRVLCADGTWLDGPLRMVGNDHAVLEAGGVPIVLPFDGVDAWTVRGAAAP